MKNILEKAEKDLVKYEKRKKKVPKVSKQVRVDEILHRKLKLEAYDRGMTITRLIACRLQGELEGKYETVNSN